MSPHSSVFARADRTAPVFAALGDATRLKLVARLGADGPLSITDLTAGSKVTRQAIAKHLTVLADAGLVQGERRGRERIWQLEPKRLADGRRYLDRVSKEWDGALDRLRKFVDAAAKSPTGET